MISGAAGVKALAGKPGGDAKAGQPHVVRVVDQNGRRLDVPDE